MTRPIVALDVPTFDAAMAMVDRLGDDCEFYKVGLQLYAACGPRMVESLRGRGKSVFVDIKAHDIPNTVKGVAGSLAAIGASLITVHGAGGADMVRAAVEGAGGPPSGGECGVLVVTVLTSFDGAGYGAANGRGSVDIPAEVLRLSAVADASGAHGVVCSGLEAAAVRDRFPSLRTLVPGVRSTGSATHDQARVVTPEAAAEAGAAYVVLGRAVTAAANPREAYLAIRSALVQKGLPQAT